MEILYVNKDGEVIPKPNDQKLGVVINPPYKSCWSFVKHTCYLDDCPMDFGNYPCKLAIKVLVSVCEFPAMIPLKSDQKTLTDYLALNGVN